MDLQAGGTGQRVRLWRFTLIEHALGQPEQIVSFRRAMLVELDDHQDFLEWAEATWSADRFQVVLER